MKLKVVVYTLYITQLMTGAYQALMQGVIFREIITNSAFLKCKGKGKSSYSHLSLFTQTFSLSNSSTGSELSSSVIVVREMWFAWSCWNEDCLNLFEDYLELLKIDSLLNTIWLLDTFFLCFYAANITNIKKRNPR